jgi:hypothetical protein
LSEILGQGQFGDVYGGHYAHPCGTDIPVAVKTCKLEAGEGTAEKILEEACELTFSEILLGKALESKNIVVATCFSLRH